MKNKNTENEKEAKRRKERCYSVNVKTTSASLAFQVVLLQCKCKNHLCHFGLSSSVGMHSCIHAPSVPTDLY